MSTGSVYTLQLLCRLLLLFLFAVTPGTAGAADTDVTVNDTRDLPDPSPNFGPDCDSTAGTCTLRAAIQRANRQTGTHVIRLPAGTFGLSRLGRGENFADTGDLDIRGNIVIIGAGANNTRVNGVGIDRLFDVRTGSLVLRTLTVTNGNARDEDGGGIRAAGAPLTLDRVHVRANRTDGNGGGIYTNADLSMVRSAISLNQAGVTGAGINAAFAGFPKRDFSIRTSTISGNSSGGVGGAVLVGNRYDIVITNSTIAFNDDIGLNFVTFVAPPASGAI